MAKHHNGTSKLNIFLLYMSLNLKSKIQNRLTMDLTYSTESMSNSSEAFQHLYHEGNHRNI